MFGLYKKFRDGLSKTTRQLFGSIGGLFSGAKLDADSIETLEEALYGADFGVETTDEIISKIKDAFKQEKELRSQDASAIGSTVLRRVLKGSEKGLSEDGTPTVVILLGVNGSGKTTTAAKIGCKLKEDGRNVLIAACDTFRAAANEQLKSWCERLELELVTSQHGADAAAVAFDAWNAARSRGKDYLIIDTAGRLHNKANLIQELAKIRRVLQKHDPSAPHHSILVADGSLGSNSIEQARVFHREFGLTGLAVTKLDGTSRGGALVGIYRELHLPVYFLGLGEQPEDLQPFTVDNYVNAIFPTEPARAEL